MVNKEDIKNLISCKFWNKRNIGFDDVERIAITSYKYGVQGVVVTNLDFSKKARKYASDYDIILCDKSNLNHKFNFYIEKELDKRELDVLCDILDNENY